MMTRVEIDDTSVWCEMDSLVGMIMLPQPVGIISVKGPLSLWESARARTGTLISSIAQVQCSALNSGNMYIKSYGFLRYTGQYHLETSWRHLFINKSIVQLYILAKQNQKDK